MARVKQLIEIERELSQMQTILDSGHETTAGKGCSRDVIIYRDQFDVLWHLVRSIRSKFGKLELE